MHENKKVIFIINKYAGTGYRSSVEGRILSRCKAGSIDATIEFTQRRGHASELAHEAAQSGEFDTVYAVGGDGTVNEVAQGLLHSRQRMGIIPHGSGNGLARHLGIPIDFEKSLDLIMNHSVISMDSFLINDKLSVNVSGIGFDGHIARLFAVNNKRGLMGYSRLVLKEFFKFREFPTAVHIDDTTLHINAFVIAFANSSQFGNNARVAPKASVCDGLIDVCFIRKVPLIRAVSFVHQMFAGQIDQSSLVTIVKGKKMSLSLPQAMPFHADGEAFAPAHEFTITILPASIEMVIPSQSARRI